jgi:competence protein ComEA
LTLVPGLGAAVAFAWIVKEKRRPANRGMKFWTSIRALPTNFQRLLVDVGVFGAGDFTELLRLWYSATMLDHAQHTHCPLHWTDQIAAAAMVVAALTVMGGWQFLQGGGQHPLIEIDRAEPLTARFAVDMNAADLPELMQLPGVGPKLARRIVDSRASNGRFQTHDDLLRVHGIGPKTLEKLRPFLLPTSD